MAYAPEAWSSDGTRGFAAYQLGRLGQHPGAAWSLSWILVFCAAMLHASSEPGNLRAVGYLLGACFPALTLLGALGFAGRRAPLWLLPAGVGIGLVRAALWSAGAPKVGAGIALLYEAPTELLAAVIVFRAELLREARLTRWLLPLALAAVACAELASSISTLRGGARASFSMAWLAVGPVAAALEIWAMWYWIARREVRIERAEQSERGLALQLEAHLGAESELRQREARLFDFYEKAPDMIVSLDPQSGEILRCNRKFSESLGYARAELVGRSILDFADPGVTQRLGESLRTSAERGHLRDLEIRLQRRSGSMMDVQVNASVLRGSEGTPPELHAIVHNVTHFRRGVGEAASDQVLYRLMTAYSPVGIFYADGEGRCQFVNRRFCDITGLTPDEARGAGWLECLHSEDREQVIREWTEATDKGRAYRFRHRVRHRKGTVKRVQSESTPLFGEDGTISGHIGTVTLLGEGEPAGDA